MGISFSEAAKTATNSPSNYEPPDEDWVRIAKQVGRGEKTVDEAHAEWLQFKKKRDGEK